MSVKLYNYEAWLLDYAEGNLSAEQTDMLFAFLEKHPELKTELENFDIFTLPSEEITLSNKNEFKKSEPVIPVSDLDNWFLRYVERDLSTEEKNQLEEFILQSPSHRHEFSLWLKTKLETADVEFTDKYLLKHFTFTELLQPENSTILLLSLIEKQLTPEQEITAMKVVSSSVSLQRELRAFQSVLLPAENIVFVNKSSLKKERTVVVSLWQRYTVYAAAACLLFFFGLRLSSPETTDFTAKINTQKNTKPASKTFTENDLFAEENEDHIDTTLNKIITPSENFALQKKPAPKKQHLTNSSLPKENDDPVVQENKSDVAVINKKDTVPGNEQQIARHVPVIIKKDSTQKILPDEQVAMNVMNQDKEHSNDKFLTPKEFLISKVNKKLFNTDKTTFGKEEVEKSTEIGLQRITGEETTFASVDEKESSIVEFSIGGFSFSRKKSK